MGGQHHAPAALPLGRRPGSQCAGGWVGPRAGLEGYNLAPIGILYLDLPAHSKLLYLLNYPSPHINIQIYGKLPYLETPFPGYFG